MKKNIFFYSVIIHTIISGHRLLSQLAAPVHTIDFEQPDPLVVLNPSQIWQIGHPQKIIFNSAHSGNKAMLTDTINYYPPSTVSSFTVVVPLINYSWGTCLSCIDFWHKYDIDTLGSYAYTEFSIDYGQNWYIMKDTTGTSTSVYGEMAYWMPDYNASTGNNSIHPKYIKGNSNGWIKSSYCWYWVLPVTKKAENIISSPTIMPPDTVLIRFKFVSNNNSNSNEGWMIDDIILDVAYPGSCSNIEQIEKQYISVFPNPTQNVIYLQNIPEIQNACVEVTDITGKIHFSENYRYLNSQTLVILKNIDNDGMYFLNIYCDNNILRSKIIIQK